MTSILERLRELEQTATPSPWRPMRDEPHHVVFGQADGSGIVGGNFGRPFDRYLIVAARNHLPQLLAIAEAAMAVRDETHSFPLSTEWYEAFSRLDTALAALNNTEPT